jgi:hypothetical protein
MTYPPGLIVHICGGIVGVLSGTTALLVRKGSPLHRMTGKVFAVSMLCMAAGGGYLALVKSQWINVFAGVFTFYLVATAWLTVLRREKETGLLESGLLLVAFATGAGGWIMGWAAAMTATGAKGGEPPAAYFAFGTLAFLCAAGDVRMFIRGGVSGVQRLVRHLWRMCFALFIAAGSFFLGTASDPVLRKSGLRARLFSHAVRQTHLPEIPVLLIAALTLFWLFRVRFASAYRNAEQ